MRKLVRDHKTACFNKTLTIIRSRSRWTEESHILFGNKIQKELDPRVSSNFPTCKVVLMLSDFKKLKPLVKRPFVLDNKATNL